MLVLCVRRIFYDNRMPFECKLLLCGSTLQFLDGAVVTAILFALLFAEYWSTDIIVYKYSNVKSKICSPHLA